MAEDTKIEWCDDTANPWWGCTKVSPACKHCYAADWAARFGKDLWGDDSPREMHLEGFEKTLRKSARRGAKEGRVRKVFIASMADFFEDRADLVDAQVFVWELLMELQGQITPLLLTKRPERARDLAASAGCWPAGAWLGVTVENQKQADLRIPVAMDVGPNVPVFLSCEPLQGLVDLSSYLKPGGVRWVIAGGESGPKARPSRPDWFRSIRDQCVGADVPFFFKQWGRWSHYYDDGTPRPCPAPVGKKAAGAMLDGREWKEVPNG